MESLWARETASIPIAHIPRLEIPTSLCHDTLYMPVYHSIRENKIESGLD